MEVPVIKFLLSGSGQVWFACPPRARAAGTVVFGCPGVRAFGNQVIS